MQILRVLVLFFYFLSCSYSCFARNIEIAVASNFEEILYEILKVYPKKVSFNVTSASSSKLASQILAGRKFDMFFAANKAIPTKLKSAMNLDVPVIQYAKGRLLLVGASKCTFRNLRKILKNNRVAIANPRHAPYGFAAMSLINGIKESASELVFASNVKQVGLWLKTNNIKYGFVAASLRHKFSKDSCLINETLHSPIIQSSLFLSDGSQSKQSKDLYYFILKNKKIMSKYGYN